MPGGDSVSVAAEEENVFLFVPNLIGYGRIIFAIISFWFMPTNYAIAIFFYFLSAILDAFDGYAARYLNQCSRLGAMLDQLTDRCATLALVMTLCVFYPRWVFPLQLFAVVDIAAHWLHLHSHDLRGSVSHKTADAAVHPLLHLYYTNRVFLFCMCAGNEAFVGLLYLCHFTSGPRLPLVGIGLWQLLAGLAFPVALVKSLISLYHLYTAAQAIVEVDKRDRSHKQATAPKSQ